VFVSYELSIWYDDSQRNIGTKHRGLAWLVAKLTPQVHAHAGRTCNGVGGRADFKWRVITAGPVMRDVQPVCRFRARIVRQPFQTDPNAAKAPRKTALPGRHFMHETPFMWVLQISRAVNS
jgi:hypothetical protein